MASTVARAFELARSGDFTTIDQIRIALRKEKCESICLHLAGPSIRRQLRAAMAEANPMPPAT